MNGEKSEGKEDGGSSPEEGGDKADKRRKTLPELEKYWKAVREDASDFTGWTYLLQYVDQEVSLQLITPDIIVSGEKGGGRIKFSNSISIENECT